MNISERDILEKCLLSRYPKLNEKIIFKIIPELEASKGFDQKHPHHCYDLWEHTKVALSKSKPDLQIRLALLLHDIGKPYSYQEDENVRHFHGHPQKSAEIAERILQRLGYTEKEVEDICYLIKNHDTLINVNQINESNMELTKKLLYIQYCDAYAHAPQHVDKRIKKLDTIYEQIKELEKQKEDFERE